MRTEKLLDQLELYSNAIVGFIVAQSIAFAFTFGTNATFGCEITRYPWLTVALAAHFAVSTVLAAIALKFIFTRICRLSADNYPVLLAVTRAKIVIVVLFAILPIGLLVCFGLIGNPAQGRCAKVHSAALHGLATAIPYAT